MMDNKLRKSTPQPTMKPVSLRKGISRGGGYGKDVHDTGNNSWLHGGNPADKPGYVAGRQSMKKPKLRKWPS
jgi:hypothetical protein